MKLSLNKSQFCHLSSSPVWKAWLHSFDVGIFQDLVEHLRKGATCAANTAKMLSILERITASPSGEDALKLFLQRNFPHIINVQQPPPAFIESFSTGLFTIPMRTIVRGNGSKDAAVQASKYAETARAAKYDFMVIESLAYLEYVPPDMADLVDTIPPENWLTTTHKQNNQ
jgi:hypothetical protein